MGLAVLPSRLKGEMEKLAQVLVTEGTEGVRRDKLIEKHADWAEEISKEKQHNNRERSRGLAERNRHRVRKGA